MPVWLYKIHLRGLGHFGSFPAFRDSAVSRLRATEWYHELGKQNRCGMNSLAELITALANTTDEKAYAEVFEDLYVLADIDRAWIEVRS